MAAGEGIGRERPGEYTTSPNVGKDIAKMNRYMHLELATKLTPKTKERLTAKRDRDTKRLNDYMDKMRGQ